MVDPSPMVEWGDYYLVLASGTSAGSGMQIHYMPKLTDNLQVRGQPKSRPEWKQMFSHGMARLELNESSMRTQRKLKENPTRSQ